MRRTDTRDGLPVRALPACGTTPTLKSHVGCQVGTLYWRGGRGGRWNSKVGHRSTTPARGSAPLISCLAPALGRSDSGSLAFCSGIFFLILWESGSSGGL